jgi:hypothetical protein
MTFESHAYAWGFFRACQAAGLAVGYPSLDGRHAVRYIESAHCATPGAPGLVTSTPYHEIEPDRLAPAPGCTPQ